MNEEIFFIGVDVGSGSVRAALVNQNGKVTKTSVCEIQTWNPKPGYYEQSSNNIWESCVYAIKKITAHVNPEKVKGIGFDATCSLVVLDENGESIGVSDENNKEQNVIMWMDHRAQNEACLINRTKHEILKFVGGKVSPEMEMPKMLWLKTHKPQMWSKIGKLFDLPDFLTWKATGSTNRSLCSLVCKWNYEYSVNKSHGWNIEFLKEIGLDDLAEDNFEKIGNVVLKPGEFCGFLSAEAASSLGLHQNTAVGTSMIDAHAGGLGMIGTHTKIISQKWTSRLGLISGTSTCLMAVSVGPIEIPGVWGPYYSAMIPDMWLNEAGQSASGRLVDYIISSHPVGMKLLKSFKTNEVRSHLRNTLHNMALVRKLPHLSYLTKHLHMWPDFHGNRSPLADPEMKGMLTGLTIDDSEENLALLYLATLQALSYSTRHIIKSLKESGYEAFECLIVCGGLGKDILYIETQADAIGLPILLPHERESVLVGAAILGACASKHFSTIQEAINHMSGDAVVIKPNLTVKHYHDQKFNVFLEMFQDQLKYRNIMNK